jgi:hypothetical protein
MQAETGKNKGNGKTRKLLGIPGRSVETPKDVSRLLQELLDKHNQDWIAAASEAKDIVMADPGSWDSFIRPMVNARIDQMAMNLGHVNRSTVFNGFVPTLPKGVSGETLCKQDAQAQVDAMSDFLDGFRLNKVKKILGDATREDLAEEINMYTDHAMWNDKKRDFLTRIHDCMKPGQMVREVVDNAELARLRKLTEKRTSRWDKYRK